MRHFSFLFVIGVLCGCSDSNETVISPPNTNVEPSAEDISESEEDGSVPDSTESDTSTDASEAATDTAQVEDIQDATSCGFGTVNGLFCSPGELPDQSCTQLALVGECNGESKETLSVLPPSGGFSLEEVPLGSTP